MYATVGSEIAKYIDVHDQAGSKRAIDGNRITPTPQNDSNKQITDFRYFPPVISATEMDQNYRSVQRKYKNVYK